MKSSLKEKLINVKMLIMDVDGVLTDGKIVLDERGKEIKCFDVRDGYGLAVLQRSGIKTAVITARSSGALTARMNDLKVDFVYQDAYPKLSFFDNLIKKADVNESEVCYMGDDLPDLCVLKKAGFSVAVSNAAEDVRKAADYVTKKKGGDGAVREVVEMILKAQGKWKKIIKEQR